MTLRYLILLVLVLLSSSLADSGVDNDVTIEFVKALRQIQTNRDAESQLQRLRRTQTDEVHGLDIESVMEETQSELKKRRQGKTSKNLTNSPKTSERERELNALQSRISRLVEGELLTAQLAENRLKSSKLKGNVKEKNKKPTMKDSLRDYLNRRSKLAKTDNSELKAIDVDEEAVNSSEKKDTESMDEKNEFINSQRIRLLKQLLAYAQFQAAYSERIETQKRKKTGSNAHGTLLGLLG